MFNMAAMAAKNNKPKASKGRPQTLDERAAALRALKAYYSIKNNELRLAAGYGSMAHVSNVLRAHPKYICAKALNRLELALKEILGERFPFTNKIEIVIEFE